MERGEEGRREGGREGRQDRGEGAAQTRVRVFWNGGEWKIKPLYRWGWCLRGAGVRSRKGLRVCVHFCLGVCVCVCVKQKAEMMVASSRRYMKCFRQAELSDWLHHSQSSERDLMIYVRVRQLSVTGVTMVTRVVYQYICFQINSILIHKRSM